MAAASGNGGNRASGPRCIALVGPFQSGKTTLLEAILSRTGAIARQGTVEAGTTVSDSDEDEHKRQLSISMSLTHADWQGRKFTPHGTELVWSNTDSRRRICAFIDSAERSLIVQHPKFSDLAIVDPVVTTSYQTRDHGFMVYDTLYGQDDDYRVRPQMVEGHVTENDGKTWKITLRDGMKFHDGEPVRAKDAVASIKRWSGRDLFGKRKPSGGN